MSANVGEALKPLSKVASGGELARIMLAMKIVLAEKDHVPTMIFDEVDAGVSGRAAQKVAEKSERLLLKEWREHRHVHENYHGDTGQGCMKQSEPFYHWGALLGYIAIDADDMI